MKIKTDLLSYCTLLILLFGIFLNSYYTVQKKEGFFVDELFTFLNANYPYTNIKAFSKALFDGELSDYVTSKTASLSQVQVLQLEDAKKLFYITEDEHLNLFNVYVAQTIADSHPPLYYYIIHIISWITKSPNIKMIGFGLNIFLLLGTCIILFFIVKTITKRYELGLITVIYYGFSAEFLNSVVFFRMYTLSAFWITLLSYLYVQYYKSNYENRFKICICLVQFLSLYTHYFSIFYILPLFFITIYKLRGTEYMKEFVRANLYTCIVYCLLWPQFIIQVAKGNVLNACQGHISIFYRLYGFVDNVINYLFGGSYIYFNIFILSIVVSLIKLGKEKSINNIVSIVKNYFFRESGSLLISGIIFFVTISLIAPWVAYRYITPIMPIFVVFIIIGWKNTIGTIITRKIYQSIIVFCVTVYVTIFLMPYISLPNLYDSNEIKDFYLKYKNYPAIVLGNNLLPLGYFEHPYYILLNNTNFRDSVCEYVHEKEVILYSDNSLKLKESNLTFNNCSFQLDSIGGGVYLLRKE